MSDLASIQPINNFNYKETQLFEDMKDILSGINSKKTNEALKDNLLLPSEVLAIADINKDGFISTEDKYKNPDTFNKLRSAVSLRMPSLFSPSTKNPGPYPLEKEEYSWVDVLETVVDLNKNSYVYENVKRRVLTHATLTRDYEIFPGTWLEKGTLVHFSNAGKVIEGTLAGWTYTDGAKKQHPYFSAGKIIRFDYHEHSNVPFKSKRLINPI